MSTTFSDVDASSDPERAADCQDQVDAWPSVVAYKARPYQLLGGRRRVLDVGSGPGNDLVAIGAGRTVGIDPSMVMCRRGKDRGARVVAGDALRLPFADGAFDGVRAIGSSSTCPIPSARSSRWYGLWPTLIRKPW